MHESIEASWKKKLSSDESIEAHNQKWRYLSQENKERKDALINRIDAVFAVQDVSTHYDKVYEIKKTGLIPLGQLGVTDNEGRSHGFAKILTYSNTDRVETTVSHKGLFRRKDIEVTYIPTEVTRFGVVLYAANEDGANEEKFDVAIWSTVLQPEEAATMLDTLETYIAEIEAAIVADEMASS